MYVAGVPGYRRYLVSTCMLQVFLGIGDISYSLIREFDILLDGCPVWDIQVSYSRMVIHVGIADSTASVWPAQSYRRLHCLLLGPKTLTFIIVNRPTLSWHINEPLFSD